MHRLVLLALVVVTLAAGVVALLAPDRSLRAWAAALVVAGALGSVIAWLAGSSVKLSGSGKDPQDFTWPPNA